MADYTIQLAVTFSRDVDPKNLQSELNNPDVRKRLGETLSRVLTLPQVRKKYPEAGTFAVVSVTVEKKDNPETTGQYSSPSSNC
jgi:hypothetical protein